MERSFRHCAWGTISFRWSQSQARHPMMRGRCTCSETSTGDVRKTWRGPNWQQVPSHSHRHSGRQQRHYELCIVNCYHCWSNVGNHAQHCHKQSPNNLRRCLPRRERPETKQNKRQRQSEAREAIFVVGSCPASPSACACRAAAGRTGSRPCQAPRRLLQEEGAERALAATGKAEGIARGTWLAKPHPPGTLPARGCDAGETPPTKSSSQWCAKRPGKVFGKRGLPLHTN